MRATYAGWCFICDDRIRPGDDIRTTRDHVGDDDASWVHADCLTEAEAPPNFAARADTRPRCIVCADLVDALGRCPNCGT